MTQSVVSSSYLDKQSIPNIRHNLGIYKKKESRKAFRKRHIMNAIFDNVLYEWQLMIDDFLEWWSGIYAIPKTKAYIFSFVVILLLYIIRKIFARIFLKLKSDDRYVRRMHLHTRAIKIDAPAVLTRDDYGYQGCKFKSVPFGIIYGLVLTTLFASIVYVHITGGYGLIPFAVYIISRFGEYAQTAA